MPRPIHSELRVPMRVVEFDNGQGGGYLIGNCNIDIGLKNVFICIIPPINEGDSGEIVIINDMHDNSDFENHMSGEFENLPCYFFGEVNMDIRALNTVWKFFPKRFGEENILVINQTQHKQEGKRISNPLEVKIFMGRRNL